MFSNSKRPRSSGLEVCFTFTMACVPLFSQAEPRAHCSSD